MKKIENLTSKLMKFIYCIEVIVALVILITILAMVVNMCKDIFSQSIFSLTREEFNSYLSFALTLVVGLEFIKLLCRNTPQALVTVMLLAISRQMIVEHLNMYEIVFGVLSLAIIFAIRKYLFVEGENPKLKH